jgi:hypothetical protein
MDRKQKRKQLEQQAKLYVRKADSKEEWEDQLKQSIAFMVEQFKAKHGNAKTANVEVTRDDGFTTVRLTNY